MHLTGAATLHRPSPVTTTDTALCPERKTSMGPSASKSSAAEDTGQQAGPEGAESPSGTTSPDMPSRKRSGYMPS